MLKWASAIIPALLATLLFAANFQWPQWYYIVLRIAVIAGGIILLYAESVPHWKMTYWGLAIIMVMAPHIPSVRFNYTYTPEFNYYLYIFSAVFLIIYAVRQYRKI